MRDLNEEFPCRDLPRVAAPDDEVARLIHRCQECFPNLVDMTEHSGGDATVKDIKELLKVTAPATGIRLTGIDYAVAPLPRVGWEHLIRDAFKRFAQWNHPGAELEVTTGLKSPACPDKNFQATLSITKNGVRIHFFVASGSLKWTEHIAKLLDPHAVLTRKEGKLVAESPSGTKFYHFYSPMNGELCRFGLHFEEAETRMAIARYSQICAASGFKVVVQKCSDVAPFAESRAKSERFWHLEIRSREGCKLTASDELNLLQSLKLPIESGEIRFDWSLVNWQSWRMLRDADKKLGDGEGGGSALFAFDAPSGKPALFELIVTKAGKYRPAFRFATEEDLVQVHKTLGLKRQENLF